MKSRIQKLCEQKGMKIKQLERQLKFSNGSIGKGGSMSCDRLKQVADFFGVTMDYLMTGEESISERYLSFEEQAVIRAYRAQSEDTKNNIAAILKIKRQDTGLQSSSKAG